MLNLMALFCRVGKVFFLVPLAKRSSSRHKCLSDLSLLFFWHRLQL